MSMPLILKSTGSAFVLPDIGVIIGSEGSGGSDFSGIPELIRALGQSSNLRARVVAGTVKVNNGSVDLAALAGQQYLNQMWLQAGNDVAVAMGQVEGVVTDAQHGTRAGGTTHPVVTTTVDGYMSAADKVRLDGLSTFRQQFQTEIANNRTTASRYPTYDPTALLSIAFTKQSAGSTIRIDVGVTCVNSTASGVTYFDLRFDGTRIAGLGVRSPGGGSPQGISTSHLITGQPAGAHTVSVHWCNDGGTSGINVAAAPQQEHGILIVEEIGA